MIRRARLALAGLLMGGAVVVSPARADHQPVIVVPGRSDVPVMINGVDARGAAVYDDWGLYRAGHGSIMIEGVGPNGGPEAWPNGYYPATGRSACLWPQGDLAAGQPPGAGARAHLLPILVG